MAIEHRNIPDNQRHEPKGITTATQGHVYVADGNGGGSWLPIELIGQDDSQVGQIIRSNGDGSYTWKHSPEGWAYYKHNGANQTFNNTFSKLLVDGLEPFSNTSYLPYQIRGVGQLWDNASNKMTPITIGDSYDVRVDVPVISETGSPTEITMQLDIGPNTTPSNVINSEFKPAGRATPYQFTFNFDVFSLDTFKTNGGQFFLKTDSGSITVANPAIKITRKTAGDF